MSPVIRVESLGKRFRSYSVDRSKSLKEAAMVGWQRPSSHDSFWVFRDLSFDVFPGEMLGIVGCNGAGKSTLLLLIAGLLRADEGQIRLTGKLGALLDLGRSLHPQLTGRENIKSSGLLGGLTNSQVNARAPQIIAFADIDGFLDAPIRTYSSGMKARLAFSIAVHTDPDILLVDEFLFVGDQFFQERCLERIRTLMDSGTAVLLTSHVATKIRENCSRVLWLDKTGARALGASDEVMEQYQNATEVRNVNGSTT